MLIANRGEIAVRIARACRDAGLGSVAVYATPDRDAVHVTAADEAYSLDGSTAAESYLVTDKLLEVAARSGADAVHPGYGFLAENADFAAAVIAAGLVWIGPPPAAIDSLGDKVKARHIAQRAGAPLVPGTAGPVQGADEIVSFAQEHGLPVAIKAAYGGGGRGLKVARTIEEIPDLFESATREAVAAFGRGECFVERFLDHPRHVETQCLADEYGAVVVVSTRDCSLQRRNQKLVEEAPAPFLTTAQSAELYRASKAILAEAGYVGAGTCEFLVGPDGTISFLEVNTRLQVEHPVTEEVSGLDLVREQFRIAAGEPLGYGDPVSRGHSIEFRINGEDAGRNFLPQPGSVRVWETAERARGPARLRGGRRFGGRRRVRLDAGQTCGHRPGSAAGPAAGPAGAGRVRDRGHADRAALPPGRGQRSGVRPGRPADPVHRAHRWIETEFENTIEAWTPGPADTGDATGAAPERVVVEVGGKRLEVVLPAGFGAGAARAGSAGPGGPARKAPRRSAGAKAGSGAGGDALTSPMQGTIVKVAVEEGQRLEAGDLVVVLEAMKMEQPLTAHRAGTGHRAERRGRPDRHPPAR